MDMEKGIMTMGLASTVQKTKKWPWNGLYQKVKMDL